jgi:acyl-CoA reductase-like NAD-dependent aldehyde dehydrogenase
MKMLIDSVWVEASDGAWFEVRNPATGEVLDQVPNATLSDAQYAVEAAQRGAERMGRLPAYDRAAILHAVADAMDASLPELADLLARENGKPITQIRDEIRVAARIFRGFAEESKRIFGRVVPLDAVPGQERHMAFTIRQPLGVVAGIVPSNYPVELYAHKAAAALAAGNAFIAKPPQECPLAILRIAKMIEDVGVPHGAHQVLTSFGVAVGECLAAHPDVQLISATGSVNMGKRVSELAAQTVKLVHLELSGNDALIVCADADLDKATDAIVLGRLARGNGQICCAVKRIFAEESVRDSVVELLTEKAQKLKVGNPLEEDTDVGPLISLKAAERVEAAIQHAVNMGARLTTGGHRRDTFVEPTVLTNVTPEYPVFYEEVFGPVAPVVAFQHADDVVEIANRSPFGLQAGVFTTDINRAFDIAYRLQVGGVIVNWGSALRVETLGFGGIKLSGHGRESVHDTLTTMTYEKSIVVHNALSHFVPRQ